MSIVVTSINAPNNALRALAQSALAAHMDFIVIGDTKSPLDFSLQGCRYFDIENQIATGLQLATACPTRHYARKNIGYLIAIRDGAQFIIDTDDDNVPNAGFFASRQQHVSAAVVEKAGWVNVYRYFSDANIWPRGFPLQAIRTMPPAFDELRVRIVDCPIQQGLVDGDPDVDAIYRLCLPLPQNFRTDRRIALGMGAWCPFNSQNSTWWPQAFALLYLPAHCSFRMTDIWRSFVAYRIIVENGWYLLFHEPTMWQDRNEHDLMRDFADEIPGYLNNDRICRALEKTRLLGGSTNLVRDLRRCYETLVDIGVVDAKELTLVDAWIADLSSAQNHAHD